MLHLHFKEPQLAGELTSLAVFWFSDICNLRAAMESIKSVLKAIFGNCYGNCFDESICYDLPPMTHA